MQAAVEGTKDSYVSIMHPAAPNCAVFSPPAEQPLASLGRKIAFGLFFPMRYIAHLLLTDCIDVVLFHDSHAGSASYFLTKAVAYVGLLYNLWNTASGMNSPLFRMPNETKRRRCYLPSDFYRPRPNKCFVYGILGLLRISWLLGVLFRLFIVVYSSTKRKEKKRPSKQGQRQ
jgi:hypothetical protein